MQLSDEQQDDIRRAGVEVKRVSFQYEPPTEREKLLIRHIHFLEVSGAVIYRQMRREQVRFWISVAMNLILVGVLWAR
jgi:hypothetical protein